MSTNDQAYRKLQRIEGLIKLKDQAKQIKEEVQNFVIDKTGNLRSNGELLEIDFDVNDDLTTFLTIFDSKITEIKEALLEMAPV